MHPSMLMQAASRRAACKLRDRTIEPGAIHSTSCKQTMPSRREAMSIHTALQLWHRMPKWIVYLIILIVPGALLVATLVALGLHRAGARQTPIANAGTGHVGKKSSASARSSRAFALARSPMIPIIAKKFQRR